jgi:uncharacterized protein RhaS with RHS repeats
MSYDPTVGRWTTEDPIAFEGGDANLYRYVGNSPINAPSMATPTRTVCGSGTASMSGSRTMARPRISGAGEARKGTRDVGLGWSVPSTTWADHPKTCALHPHLWLMPRATRVVFRKSERIKKGRTKQ